MAKRTREIETLWWDWLSTAERLQQTLHEQTVALTLRDINRLDRLQPELEQLQAHMQIVDERAAEAARALSEQLDCEANLRSLVGALDKKEGQDLQGLANRVIVAGRYVQTLLAKNRRLIENELEFVQGTLCLVAKVASEQEGPYRAVASHTNVLLNQAA